MVSAPWPAYADADGDAGAALDGSGGNADGPGVADVTGGTG